MRYLFTTSWVLLLVLAAAMSAISLISASRALGRSPDGVTATYSLEQLDATNHEAADAMRGRRLTASSFAFGFGLLLAIVVLVPYRRGERWAWWAVLVAVAAVTAVSLLRVPLMGLQQGASGSVITLVVLAIGLAAGAPRMFASAKS